jgi:hypothetical protein
MQDLYYLQPDHSNLFFAFYVINSLAILYLFSKIEKKVESILDPNVNDSYSSISIQILKMSKIGLVIVIISNVCYIFLVIFYQIISKNP